MRHVLAVEATEHLENGIHSANVRQEGVAKATSLGSTLHQSGNIGDLQNGGYLALGLECLHHVIKTLVGHGHTSDVGVDGAERIVLSGNLLLTSKHCATRSAWRDR